MIDQELIKYLDARIVEIKTLIATEIRGIREKLLDTLGPVREDVGRLRSDIADLYQKDRDQAAEIAQLRTDLGDRCGQSESRIVKLEEARDQKDRSASRTITILSVAIAAIGVLAGVFLGFR